MTTKAERSNSSRGRLSCALLVSLVALSCGWWHHSGSWAQLARYDPIWGFVEEGPGQGTLAIDRFLYDRDRNLNTGDWARNPQFRPETFSNKAPGTTLLGIPVYAGLYHLERAADRDPTSPTWTHINAWLLNLALTVLPVALSTVAAWRLAALWTHERWALTLTVLYSLGTLMWPFSTQLWGHTTAAAFVMFALERIARPGPRAAFWAGFWVGLATLTDYGAAPIAVGLVALAAARAGRRREALWVALGGAGPALVFVAYHKLVFGSLLTLASSHSNPTMVSDADLGGLLTWPSPSLCWQLSLSPHRGLLLYSPLLLFAPLGWSARDDRAPGLGLTCGLLFLLMFALNASFNGWHGGLCAGPRYLIPALPLAFVGLARATRRRPLRRWVFAIGLISVANAFVISASSPLTPDGRSGSPLIEAYTKVLGARPGGTSVRVGPRVLTAADIGFAEPPQYPERLWPTDVWLASLRSQNLQLGDILVGQRGWPSLLPLLLLQAALIALLARFNPPDGPGERGKPTRPSSA